MNFTFTDEQLSLGAAVRQALRDHCHPSDRGSGWKQLAELGFFTALVGEEAGGLGLALIDVIPAVEETGRAAMPGPVVETLAAAPYAPGAGRIALLVDGVALDADLADVVLDATGGAPADCVLEPLAAVDPGRMPFAVDRERTVAPVQERPAAAGPGQAPFTLDPVGERPAAVGPGQASPTADPARERPAAAAPGQATLTADPVREAPLAVAAGPGATGPLLRRVTVGVSAQLVGVARELLARSVEYAKTRTQFGQPIGAFQAVKHQLADVAIAVEFAAPLVHRAALSVDRAGSRQNVDRDVSAAKVAAGEAAALAARAALQVHGAIGYTDELDLRFWLSRTWSLTAAYGTTAAHRARVTEAVFGA
ncbi:acyl-CoA dehydrogenase family protein [Nonomuraea sp. NPDC003804]|uniref:acyl-CoA dehydrogenase family protein n=1 Tax=Nonomuraea sp. NPDC003804 TaxID=3154547 RepID=UPI0033B0E4A8